MESFIKTVLLDLKRKDLNLEDLFFILPSQRAGVFLKQQLSQIIDNPVFAPHILSIEEFVEELSGLEGLSNTDLLFWLYNSYLNNTKKEDQEPFESFASWAQILLQDFNEIDRYNTNQNAVFDYLQAIKELNHWSLETTEQTDLVRNHLKFWKNLKAYYKVFTDLLLQNKKGYQGLIYREATENLEAYIENNSHRTHIFLGFNALNTCESQIIQGLLQNDLAHIYWDADKAFIDDTIHGAGFFIREYRSKWNYFKKHPFNWITSHYSDKKNIEAIGIPKLVGQAKYIGQLLEDISSQNEDLKNVAIVLGEENLLIPLLNSIPKHITQINVTMGLPLRLVPLSSLFELLFSCHKNNNDRYYFKEVIDIISHPLIYSLFETATGNISSFIIGYIQRNNLVYITVSQLKKISHAQINSLIDLLFDSWKNDPKTALSNCSKLIVKLKESLVANKQANNLELEYLYRFDTLFNELTELNNNYQYLNSIESLYSVYKDLLKTETLDFRGEPLEGLQIMGMLESRVLDFETVIISSVNEGILPSGKTNNSFIPFDVKLENNLPTFKEKDAVYTYHFYRLIQRAKDVYLLYNTEIDTLKGGEKSRFITQLEVSGIHKIKHTIVSPNVPVIEKKLQRITKTDLILNKLKVLSNKGLSPSSLTNYIRNPLDFYYEKILGIKEFEDVEENIAAKTLGSVLHNTLEEFYKPLEGSFLTLEHLKNFKTKIESTITNHFKKLYKDGDFTSGKNLIIFEIAKRYIINFLDSEIENLKTGNTIKILAIEADETIELNIEGIDFPVKLKGKVDRIDLFNGMTRIIDYKSGKVEQNKVEIVNWEDITSDYDKYSKSFQILCYAHMMHQKKKIQLPIEAGIISFKNLSAGFLKFGKKESIYSRNKDQQVNENTLSNFEIELHRLIEEICNPNIDFIENQLD
ncbi:PD-(D/E)XK nuclease family protein [Winogradskyella sp.]|uniref:PD-(D/E)XK nuclease family protein n=1 Tax=Winogradskyella sp. TaxID=1883156 RepID=UPI0026288118|nr:PD-(D/E)XK nuclease family protein [Winogradskyella sp.]